LLPHKQQNEKETDLQILVLSLDLHTAQTKKEKKMAKARQNFLFHFSLEGIEKPVFRGQTRNQRG